MKFSDKEIGLLAAFAFVLLASSSPAITRLGVSKTLTTGDLMLLRCCGGLLMFAPYVFLNVKKITPNIAVVGFVLAFLQGWGTHLLSVFGLKFAPAAHAAALGPGCAAIWIAIFGWYFYRNRISRSQLIGLIFIAAGAVSLLIRSSTYSISLGTLVGDLMFLTASAFGALYLTYMHNHKLNPTLGAALVAFFSGLCVVPYLLIFDYQSGFSSTPLRELLVQGFYQGICVGGFFVLLISFAVSKIGSQVLGFFIAAVPIFAIGFGYVIADDEFSILELIAAISIAIGITLGATLKPK